MRKLIIISLLCVSCVACKESGGPGYRAGEVCKQGVVYYTGIYNSSPAFKPDGSLYLCDIKGEG